MRPLPIRPASADPTPAALRGKASLRAVCATALAAAIGFAPAIMIASPAAAAITGFTFDDATVSATEGGELTFTVRRLGGSTKDLAAKTLNWSIESDTATADDDYEDVSGELDFALDNKPSDTQSMTITVPGVADLLDEDDETFTLVVADADDSDSKIMAEGTLLDDDDAPTYKLAVSETTIDEADNAEVEVTAELSAASGRDISIPVSTVAGTAKAGQDYTALESDAAIVIQAGDTDGTLVPKIAIDDDTFYEESLQDFTVEGGTSTET